MGVPNAMPVYETYAARVEKAAKGDAPDVYVYDELPQFLRKQLAQILTDCIGTGFKQSAYDTFHEPPNANETWDSIAGIMDRERQSFRFEEDGKRYGYGHCLSYLRTSDDIYGVLSLIEICCRFLAYTARQNLGQRTGGSRGDILTGIWSHGD